MQRMLIKLAKKKTNMHFCEIKRQKLFVPEKFGNILLLPLTASTFTNIQVLSSKTYSLN